MSTEYFKRDPIFTAGRLFSEGQGVESNPFPYDTADHKAFDAEIERLQMEEMKQEAQS